MSGARPARSSHHVSAASPARRVALEVLTAVRTRDAYANLLLPALLGRARLTTADAAFATELTYGTLRRLGHYDAVLALASGRTVQAIDPPLLDVLRLAAHQLLGMRTPPHAAVHQAVEQARDISRGAAGFANAVLRKVGADGDDGWTARLLLTATDDDERAGITAAHPTWIVTMFREALTAVGTPEELPAALAADNVPPPVTLAALPGLADRADLPGALHPASPIGAVLAGGDPAIVPSVAAGAARVQDAGSQVSALLLTRARPIRPGERWLDLCAGPGGKAAVLAAEAAPHGVRVIANELAPARAALVEQALAAVPGDHPVVVGDGTAFPHGGERFDRVLLDAPCSGLGALRRRPEARWRKQPTDLPGLVRLQARLLDAAVASLAPGGLLAYVTCSPVPAETDVQIAAALARHPELTAVPTADALDALGGPPAPATARGTAVQLWPHRHATDAMFVQLLTLR
ncbi:RsmB/NOP family class I SAM-dependent RNA methyltransferase [uncultured Amnibacterium sp.]|uniref:RsmB/NOP family class I SAM-dependent RNA methyltransferase n=1 Tax=uncultured Amnibacterium sp. TaxID=1631851 RepID=UPI0035CA837C